MLERILIGLYGGAAPALFTIALANLILGSRFELLVAFGGHGAWYFIGAWIAWTFAMTTLARRKSGWQITLWATSALLVALGSVGVVDAWRYGRASSSDVTAGIASGCAALALACALLALRIPRSAVQQDKPAKARKPRSREWVPAARFAFVAIALVYAFGIAQTSPPASIQGGAGALGLLIAFFVSLPAASIAVWFPRSAAALHLGAACTYLWLDWWLLALGSLAICLFESRLTLRRASIAAGEAA